MSETDGADLKCDYCRQPLVDSKPVEFRGESYNCCSAACSEALAKTESVFIDQKDHRRFNTGVAGLDHSLPEGLPRNSFVLMVGHTGTREEAIQAEIVWRTLQRGESAIIVALTEPPISVVENFLTMDWNVLPYLESGDLTILDCFTYRVDDRDRLYERMSPWNTHLDHITDPQTIAVRDISDGAELRSKLDNGLEDHDMVEFGVVIIDSLVEFGSLVQPIQAYDFVKNIRAEVCKGRFVPIFAGGIGTNDDQPFPLDLEYVVDGLVDLEFNDNIIEDTLLKRLRVRKMRGVLTISEWYTFEYTSGLGLVTFDPTEEISD